MDLFTIVAAYYIPIAIAGIAIVYSMFQPKEWRTDFFILLSATAIFSTTLTALFAYLSYDARPWVTVLNFIFVLNTYRLNKNAAGWLALLALLVGIVRVRTGLDSSADFTAGVLLAGLSIYFARHAILPIEYRIFRHLIPTTKKA
jgi:hypothetical protein